MNTQLKCLLVAISLFYCANGQSTAHQFVSNLYSHYQNDFSSINANSIDTIYSPEILNLMKLNEKQEQSGLGYDPVCDCQDNDGFKMGKIDIDTKNNVEYADVRFSIFDTKYNIKLKLLKEKSKWFISDVITSRGSLYELLKKNVAKKKE